LHLPPGSLLTIRSGINALRLLAERVMLPPFLEPQRAQIEARLKPIAYP
jgi:hypothetical protein